MRLHLAVHREIHAVMTMRRRPRTVDLNQKPCARASRRFKNDTSLWDTVPVGERQAEDNTETRLFVPNSQLVFYSLFCTFLCE